MKEPDDFRLEFGMLQDKIWKIAETHGFHEKDHATLFQDNPERIAEMLMLIVTEAAEAMEAVRRDDFENFKEELADIVIRVLDTSESTGIDLIQEIIKKCDKNKKREFKHGGKRS